MPLFLPQKFIYEIWGTEFSQLQKIGPLPKKETARSI